MSRGADTQLRFTTAPLDGAKRSGARANLFLQVWLPEGQQEPLDVLGAQAVDAACVDGSPQELVHLVLWVHVFLRVPENEMPESQKTRFQPKVDPMKEESKSTSPPSVAPWKTDLRETDLLTCLWGLQIPAWKKKEKALEKVYDHTEHIINRIKLGYNKSSVNLQQLILIHC